MSVKVQTIQYNNNDYFVEETLLNNDNVKVVVLNSDRQELGGVLIDHDLQQADLFIAGQAPQPSSYFAVTALVELQDLSTLIKYIVTSYTSYFNNKHNIG